MVLIGAYPDTFHFSSDTSPLSLLSSNLDLVAPPNVALHLLPFNPSSGDGGFAPDDWFKVRSECGSWKDIKNISTNRKLIVDCIYNHVGTQHKFIKLFFEEPAKFRDIIYAFDNNDNMIVPKSPRGRSVLCEYTINNKLWRLWQTFSSASIDINLNHPTIQKEIDIHLDFLISHGIWGVRLDGIAYFGKEPDTIVQRHHPASYRIGRIIANKAIEKGLKVNAQLDCDVYGLDYFPEILGYNVPIVDYSYSAYILHALFTKNPAGLGKHLEKTWHYKLIRCPRTHDGILLRSLNLFSDVKTELIFELAKYDILPTIVDSSFYEYNASFPYLLSLGSNKDDLYKKIELIVFLTGFLPGWCYLYLPFLIGFIPENYFSHEVDLRTLNRKTIPENFYLNYLNSKKDESIYSLLQFVIEMKMIFEKDYDIENSSIEIFSRSIISITRHQSKLQMLVNFSNSDMTNVEKFVKGERIGGRRSLQDSIDPLGFGIWKI